MKDFNSRQKAHFGRRAGEAGMVGTIAHWCEALQGQADLTEALKEIAGAIDAAAVNLSRVSQVDGTAKSLIYDALSDRATRPTLSRSYARSVLGPYISGVRAGTIWFASMVETDPDPALTEFHQRRKFLELAVVPLSVGEKAVDFLEIHFGERPDPDAHALLNIMVATMTRTWANRRKGLLTESTMQAQRSDKGAATMPPILGLDNPAQLSRAEYRVCLMLGRGLSNRRVCEELTISESTLRTHLRNIYAKTQTSGRSELIYHLLSATPARVAATAKVA